MKMAFLSATFLLAVLGMAAPGRAQTVLKHEPAPPDALGTIQSSSVTCQGSLAGGTCYALDITCPQLPHYTAYVKIYEPTVPVAGTVLFATGGDGTDLVESLAYGPLVIQKVTAQGYTAIELTYGSPFDLTEKGWQSDANGAGVRAAACRFATVAHWIHENFVAAATPLCAAGNSAGGELIGESLAHYGSADILSFAEISSGPPFERVDYACENNQPEAISPCSGLQLSLGVNPTTSAEFIDPAYPPPAWCSSSYSTHSTVHQAQFLNDSITSPDAVLNYPNTFVNFYFGQKDTTSAIRQGMLYQAAITSATATGCGTGVGHEVESSKAGAEHVAADILKYCKRPVK